MEKIDLSNTAFLVHFRKDTYERLENLKIVLNFYNKHCKNLQFIVVFDDKEFDLDYIQTMDIIKSLNSENKVKLHYNSDIYERPLCYNIAQNLTSRAFVVTIDTDVIVHPENILYSIQLLQSNEQLGMVIPYNGLSFFITDYEIKNKFKRRLSYDFLLEYVPEKRDVYYKNKNVLVANNKSIGGCVVFKSKVYEEIGGYNPMFKGWGWEDNEIINRMYKFGYRIGRYNNSEAYLWHLPHGDSIKDNHQYYNDNIELNSKVVNMTPEEVKFYTNLWKHDMTNDRNYLEYLMGKKVALVGPAPTIIGSKQGDLIDSYDIVVRVNKAVPIPTHLTRDIGKRTNILYNCLNPSPECGGPYLMDEWKKLDWLCCPYPAVHPFDIDITRFKFKNENTIPFHTIDKETYLTAAKEMNTRPNSGIGTIIDLMFHPIKELYVTGFTFFKGGYYSDYRQKNEKQVMDFMNRHRNHEQEPQIEYIRKMFYGVDYRFNPDEEMRKILDNVSI